MLSALLGTDAQLASLKKLIIDKTEGNPFFMEETVQVLFGDGALVRNGTVKLTKSLSELRIPPPKFPGMSRRSMRAARPPSASNVA